MSPRASICPIAGCGALTAGGRCPQHAIDYGYQTPRWQSVRVQRLALDGHRCQLRHAGCTGRATTVHLDPDCHGDHALATITTTTSACAHCHGVEDAPRAGGRSPGEISSASTPPPHPRRHLAVCTESAARGFA